MNKKSSCYNCEFRRVGCHKNCNSYKQYLQRLNTIKENREKEKLLNKRRLK